MCFAKKKTFFAELKEVYTSAKFGLLRGIQCKAILCVLSQVSFTFAIYTHDDFSRCFGKRPLVTFWSTLYTTTEICTIVWRRHTNMLLKVWNVSIRLTWLTIASNVLNRSFLAFHRGKLWQKTIFVNSLLYYIKLRTIVQRSCTGLPTKYLRKQSMRSYTTIDQVEKCCKMLKNHLQSRDIP